MPFLFTIEISFQLPVALYSVYRLGRGDKGTTGGHELLLLTYALEAAFSTALCIVHTTYLDPADFTPAQWDVFTYQLMGPWIAIRKPV